MRFFRPLGVLLCLASLTLVGCDGTTKTALPTFKHVFIIMMENQNADAIYGNMADAPYINGTLLPKYGVARSYYGVTHPSLPNYLALLSGDSQGIWDDCAPGAGVTCAPMAFGVHSGDFPGMLTPAQEQRATTTPHSFTGPTLVDQLEGHGLTWQAYMESMPIAGFAGATNAHSLYAAKHNPFAYFGGIYDAPARAAHVVPFTAEGFRADIAGAVPSFVWISPNQCNDMHGLSQANAEAENVPLCANPTSGLNHGAIQAGDAFLAGIVPQITASATWGEGAALAIVWDENDYSGTSGCCHSPTGQGGATLGGGRAPLIVLSSHQSQPINDGTTAYNHYTLLATLEKLLGLPCLANACGFTDADLMTNFFA